MAEISVHKRPSDKINLAMGCMCVTDSKGRHRSAALDSYSTPSKTSHKLDDRTREGDERSINTDFSPYKADDVLIQELNRELDREQKREEREEEWLAQQEADLTHHKHSIYRDMLMEYQKVHHFYQQHDVDNSVVHIATLQNMMKDAEGKQGLTGREVVESLSKEFESWQAENQRVERQAKTSEEDDGSIKLHPYDPVLIQQIKTQHKDIIDYDLSIKKGGWQEQKRTQDMIVSTRREEDGSVGALIEIDLKIPFEMFLSVLTDVDLYKEFMDPFEESKVEKTVARNCKIGTVIVDITMLSKRQAFFQGIGYNRLNTHNQIFFYTRSIHDRPDLQQLLGYKVHPDEDKVMLSYKYMIVRYQPIRDSFGKVTVASNIDFGLNFLPNFILEMMTKSFSTMMMDRMLEVGQNFKNSSWEKNIRKNPEMFLYFKHQIDKYLKTVQQNKKEQQMKRDQ